MTIKLQDFEEESTPDATIVGSDGQKILFIESKLKGGISRSQLVSHVRSGKRARNDFVHGHYNPTLNDSLNTLNVLREVLEKLSLKPVQNTSKLSNKESPKTNSI